ncbi:MAG TPA: hypothetical protein VGE85_10885 [Terracidiphilus sp.]
MPILHPESQYFMHQSNASRINSIDRAGRSLLALIGVPASTQIGVSVVMGPEGSFILFFLEHTANCDLPAIGMKGEDAAQTLLHIICR